MVSLACSSGRPPTCLHRCRLSHSRRVGKEGRQLLLTGESDQLFLERKMPWHRGVVDDIHNAASKMCCWSWQH